MRLNGPNYTISVFLFCSFVVSGFAQNTVDNHQKKNKMNEIKDLLQQISLKALALDSSFYSEEQIRHNWIGSEGGSQEGIDSAEMRLGIRLPVEYKEFIRLTNGFSDPNGIEPSFCPIQKIDFLKNVDPELIEIWKNTGNLDVANKMKQSLLVGGFGEEEYFLLVPLKNGKWEFWKFATWIPGEEIYPTLMEYFESVLATTDQFLNTENPE